MDIGSKPSLAKMKRAAMFLALLLLLLAAVFGWSGIRQWRAAALATELEQTRDHVVLTTDEVLSEMTAKLVAQLESAPVRAALAAGDTSMAAQAIMQDWSGAEQAMVLSADLGDAYRNAGEFGYAKLALLESALRNDTATVHVVMDGEQCVGVAAPVVLGPQQSGVVYVRLPLQSLKAKWETMNLPDSAYLALRQGSFSVLEKGSASLSGRAEVLARPVGKSGMRIVAALPDVSPGPFGVGMWSSLIIMLMLLLLAGAALVLGRGNPARLLSRHSALEEKETALEPTLSQALKVAPVPVEKPPVDTVPVVAAAPKADIPQVDPAIFRAYDIRGVVGSDLTPAVARLIGQAIGSVMHEQSLADIVVGRDGRLSGPALVDGLIDGLRRAGCHVIDIGLAPTPLVYFATYHLRTGSGVAVTGSHNPPDYNGFKIVVGGETLSGATIVDLCKRINEGHLHSAAEKGSLQQRDVADDYIRRIADDVQMDRPLKVVVDAGNGVGGAIGPRLLEAIGAEVVPLYCEVDGTFPNHHPDPSEPHNLEDLIAAVRDSGADLGLAFDGDADRLGVVTGDGKMIFPDRLLMLFAADVLQRNPGALVIYDVKCTGKLSDYILRSGGSPLMWQTGHSLIKAKMRETDAELAGEMSGHFFFKERWYGFDDGLYAAARLLEILSQRDASPSDVLAELPDSLSTPEIKVPVGDGNPHAVVARFVAVAQAKPSAFEGARLTTIDGLRADWNDGWGLVRASNTTSVLVLRFEADNAAALTRIKDLFQGQLQTLAPDAPLIF